jgi:uncharacterized protein YjeT (DUF2065 family)
MTRISIILIVFGIIYVIKPDIYRRWIWKETDTMQKRLSPKQYIKVMRITGVVFILAGTLMLAFSKR